VLLALYDPTTGRLWFPIATVCLALSLQARPQRARVQRDYPEHVEKLKVPTQGGPQDQVCIEYEALGLWIATAKDGKAGEEAQYRLNRFRALVMAGASDILLGISKPITFEERRAQSQRSLPPASPRALGDGYGSLLAEHDTRIGSLERAVFVGEPEEDDSRATSCPYCGGALRVFADSYQIVRDDHRE
jgi:hypothetical protein